jgi:hypothetical protein
MQKMKQQMMNLSRNKQKQTAGSGDKFCIKKLLYICSKKRNYSENIYCISWYYVKSTEKYWGWGERKSRYYEGKTEHTTQNYILKGTAKRRVYLPNKYTSMNSP